MALKLGRFLYGTAFALMAGRDNGAITGE